MNMFICYFIGSSINNIEQEIEKRNNTPIQKQFRRVCMQSIENVLADKDYEGEYLVPTYHPDEEISKHLEIMCGKNFSRLLSEKYCYDSETEVIIQGNDFYFKTDNIEQKLSITLFYFDKNDKLEIITYSKLLSDVQKQIKDYYETGDFGKNYKVETLQDYHRIYHKIQFNGKKLWFNYFLKK